MWNTWFTCKKNEIEQIKQKFGPESYITSCLSSCTAGILPLAITFGRLKHIQEENRLCELCDLGGESPIFSCTAHTMKNVSFPQNGSTKPWHIVVYRLSFFIHFDVFMFTDFASKAWKRKQDGLFNYYLFRFLQYYIVNIFVRDLSI